MFSWQCMKDSDINNIRNKDCSHTSCTTKIKFCFLRYWERKRERKKGKQGERKERKGESKKVNKERGERERKCQKEKDNESACVCDHHLFFFYLTVCSPKIICKSPAKTLNWLDKDVFFSTLKLLFTLKRNFLFLAMNRQIRFWFYVQHCHRNTYRVQWWKLRFF